MPDLVGILAQVIAKAGREAQVCEGLLRVADGARTKEGNLDYDLYRDRDRPWAFYVLANWANQEAVDAHVDSTYVREFLEAHTETDLAAPPTRINARMLSRPNADTGRRRPEPNSGQLTFFPFFNVRPDGLDTVQQALLGAVDSTRTDEGCLDYDLYQVADDPTTLFYRETWTGKPALDEHMNTPVFYDVVRGQVDPRLSVPWSGLSMTMVSAPGAIRVPG
ncbi:putative quinol monooxygenase [Rugosimonospora africana]|uniref:putative quinol monooxygenase n=1 Tax=Rugosimonospora africana TaxID=556532 RepID=UPI0019422BE1|nr:putative quinol monooxygenase [Rugosimonospora africana]